MDAWTIWTHPTIWMLPGAGAALELHGWGTIDGVAKVGRDPSSRQSPARRSRNDGPHDAARRTPESWCRGTARYGRGGAITPGAWCSITRRRGRACSAWRSRPLVVG